MRVLATWALGVGSSELNVFILDSLFISAFRWVLDTVTTAAEAEMNDDTALRDELLAAEMRRETGEISDAEFAAIETDLLARIRAIRERREGGSRPIALGAALESTPGTTFQVDATLSGDFHEPTGEASRTAAEDPVLDAARVRSSRSVRRRRPRDASRSPRTPRARRKLPRP
jgi:hypothetical protein